MNGRRENGGWAAKWCAGYLIGLTFLLPLKFGSLAVLPEATSFYPGDLFSWLIINWPAHSFGIFSGVALFAALVVFAPGMRPLRTSGGATALLWSFGLVLVSLIGWINAATIDYAVGETIHLAGIGAYVLAVRLWLRNRPEERRWFGLLPGEREEFLDRYRELIQELVRREDQFNAPGQYISRLGFYEKVGEAREALRLAREFYRKYPSKESLTMLAYAAVAVPDIPAMEAALAEMKKSYPDLVKLGELLYAGGLLDAGDVVRARARLDRLTDPEARFEFELQLLRSEKQFAELRDRLLERQKSGGELTPLHFQLLLMAAENLRDPALLEKVRNALAARGELAGRISMLIFSIITVMQFLAFGVAYVVVDGIRRSPDGCKLKLRKLENADIFFDVPLYVGLFGTVSAFLVMTFSPQSSRLIAYSSTLIGIIFSLILRLAMLWPLRQKLLCGNEIGECGK